MNEPWVTRDEVAEHLGLDPSTVDRLVAEGGLPSVKLGEARKSPRRFRLSEVDHWASQHGVTEGDAA